MASSQPSAQLPLLCMLQGIPRTLPGKPARTLSLWGRPASHTASRTTAEAARREITYLGKFTLAPNAGHLLVKGHSSL